MLKKILILIFMVGVPPLVLGLSLTYLDGTRTLRETIGSNFLEIADRTATGLDAIIEDRLGEIRELIERYEIAQAIKRNDEDYLINISQKIEKELHLEELQIKRSQALAPPLVGDIEYDSQREDFFFPITLPIMRQGEIRGYLSAQASVREFINSLSNFGGARKGTIKLVTSQGLIVDIFKSPPSYIEQELLKKMFSSSFDWAIAGKGKKRSLYGFAPVKSSLSIGGDSPGQYGWYIIVYQSLDEAYSQIYRILTRISLLGMGLIFIVAMVGGLTAVRFIRPLKTLQEGARMIGDGNLDHRLDIHTKDELEDVASEFNEMAQRLKSFYADLEQKIQERTKELAESNEKLKLQQDELRAAQGELLATAEELEYANSRLEEQAKELTRLSEVKSNFLSMISHELRTPLASMKEGISLVLEGVAGEVSANQHKLLNIVENNIERLHRLINDLLDIAKIEAGKMEMKIGKIDLSKLLKDAWEIMRAQADAKNITLSAEASPRLPEVYIDADRILQVIVNLISNGIKFTPSGGKVNIEAKDLNEEFAEVSVTDTGVGIKEEDLGKLFDKFQQLSSGTERKAGGTGLGLSISQEIVHSHGGEIKVESKPNQGSRFSFTIPKYKELIALYRYLDSIIKFAKQNQSRFSLILIHLPPEKIEEAKKRVKEMAFRPSDRIDTFGANQIIVLLGTDKKGAQVVAERIKEIIPEGIISGLGVSTYPEDGQNREELMLKAKGGLDYVG